MPNTVVASVSYSRQFKTTKERTVKLLQELEKELGLNSLSLMRETEHIMKRLKDAGMETCTQKAFAKRYHTKKNPSV